MDGDLAVTPQASLTRSSTNVELEARAAASYEHWVAAEGLSFRGGEDAERLGDVIKFRWEAVAANGDVIAVGLNLLVLAADGRIGCNFVES